jgi:hypothetical protein
MGLLNLDVKSATTKLATTLIMEFHPRRVVVETRAFPIDGGVAGGNGADEGGQEVDGAVERVQDRPRDLVG